MMLALLISETPDPKRGRCCALREAVQGAFGALVEEEEANRKAKQKLKDDRKKSLKALGAKPKAKPNTRAS